MHIQTDKTQQKENITRTTGRQPSSYSETRKQLTMPKVPVLYSNHSILQRRRGKQPVAYHIMYPCVQEKLRNRQSRDVYHLEAHRSATEVVDHSNPLQRQTIKRKLHAKVIKERVQEKPFEQRTHSVLQNSLMLREPDKETGGVDSGMPPRSISSLIVNPSGVGNRYGRISVLPSASPIVQTKLMLSQPGDKYEQEADRVAEQVMRMPEPKALDGSPTMRLGQPATLQLVCPACEEELQPQLREEEEKEEATLQTKPLTGQITPLVQRQVELPELTTSLGPQSIVSLNLQHHITALQSSSQPLS